MGKVNIDMSNGREVASMLSYHVNIGNRSAKRVYLYLQDEPHLIKHNICVLGLKWLIDNVRFGHDERNKNTKMFGENLKNEFADADLSFIYGVLDEECRYPIEGDDPGEIALMLTTFVSGHKIDYRGFLNTMRTEHRTNIQGVARFFYTFFELIAQECGTDSLSTLMRCKVIKYHPVFPFI